MGKNFAHPRNWRNDRLVNKDAKETSGIVEERWSGLRSWNLISLDNEFLGSDPMCCIVWRVHCRCCVESPGIWLSSGQPVGLSETRLLSQLCPAGWLSPLLFQVWLVSSPLSYTHLRPERAVPLLGWPQCLACLPVAWAYNLVGWLVTKIKSATYN